jgi:hypothetical protein
MKKYKINDSPEFKNKKSLLKWVNMHINSEEISKGVIFADGVIQLYITDYKVLSAVLNAEDEND